MNPYKETLWITATQVPELQEVINRFLSLRIKNLKESESYESWKRKHCVKLDESCQENG